jgi:hypothetical protein
MRATELIGRLQELVGRYGDQRVSINDGGVRYDMGAVIAFNRNELVFPTDLNADEFNLTSD